MKPVTLAEVQPFLDRSFSLPLRLSFRLVSLWVRDLQCYAEEGERGVAGALVVRQGKRLWEVVSVAVAPEARGRGLAAAMLAELLALAAAADRTVVAWVRHRNRASCRLFEKTGFVRARVWSFPYGFEEILPWGRHYVYRPGVRRKLS